MIYQNSCFRESDYSVYSVIQLNNTWPLYFIDCASSASSAMHDKEHVHVVPVITFWCRCLMSCYYFQNHFCITSWLNFSCRLKTVIMAEDKPQAKASMPFLKNMIGMSVDEESMKSIPYKEVCIIILLHGLIWSYVVLCSSAAAHIYYGCVCMLFWLM